MQNKILGAIDIGTNSIHLVIASVNSDGIVQILSKEKEVVRLGKSSSDMKYLSKEAIERGIATLKRYKIICDTKNAEIRAVATSATREALNKEDFILQVFNETGINIEVVSGFEEARLIYLGVLQALDVFEKKILLIDIGGGSTEFLVGKQGQVNYANSIKLGAVRLNEKFFSDGKYTKENIESARLYVRSMINPVVRELKNENFDMVVGTSGTIENIASMIYSSKIVSHDNEFNFNNFKYSKSELNEIVKIILKAENLSQIKKIPGLDSQRSDIITAGALILEQIFKEFDIKELTLSSYALREGILLDTIDKEHSTLDSADIKNIRYKSIVNLAKNCNYDETHSKKVFDFAVKIFDILKINFNLGVKEKEYLEAASILHDIGHSISHSQHHRHSYYLIRNSEILGYNNEEIELIANIARYHRKSHPKIKHQEFAKLSEANQKTVKMLAGILRIADGLDRSHKSIISDIEIQIINKSFYIKIIPSNGADTMLEIWGANSRKDLFEQLFGFKVIIEQQKN